MTKASALLPICAAMLAGFSSAAVQASDVQLFGFFDQGLAYLHEELNSGMGGPVGQRGPAAIGENGLVAKAATKNSLTQGTGNTNTWGIKGGEELNADTRVIFHLESGFLADSGEIYGDGTNIFERESSLGLDSKRFGQIKFGRMPALTTGSGTTGIFNSRTNPFGAGWGNMTGGWKFVGSLATARHNNMVNYISPSFGGLRFHAQYSFKSGQNADEQEGSSKTNRWWAVGASMTGEKFFVAAAVDCLDNANKPASSKTMEKDSYKALIGGHYDFGTFKLYGSAQYLKNVAYIGGYSTKEFAPMLASDIAKGNVSQKGFESWAIATGVDFKAAGGTVKASIGYGEAENQNVDEKNDLKRFNVGLGYIYPLSKRTSIYGITGYFQQDADWQESDIKAHEVILGLMHRW